MLSLLFFSFHRRQIYCIYLYILYSSGISIHDYSIAMVGRSMPLEYVSRIALHARAMQALRTTRSGCGCLWYSWHILFCVPNTSTLLLLRRYPVISQYYRVLLLARTVYCQRHRQHVGSPPSGTWYQYPQAELLCRYEVGGSRAYSSSGPLVELLG